MPTKPPRLPDFIGPVLSLQPPFAFKNMTASVFPLRAKLANLQRFCDLYLNIVPKELGYFRAVLPYVHLMLVNYGQLAADVANVGWFGQREVLFSVPVAWYKYEGGRPVFHDWASAAAFIYVDDPWSMDLGRTLMGWRKALVRVVGAETGWIGSPSSATSDLVLAAQVFSKSYGGSRMEEKKFLEVRSALMSALTLPDLTASPLAPWTWWSNVARSFGGYALDFAGMLQGLGLLPLSEAASPENLLRMLHPIQQALLTGAPLAPNMSMSTINLKQFRSASRPENYCYQALTNGPMRFTAINGGGLLGETRTLSGDPSGGFEILLGRWPSMPIIETLGLEVESTTRVEGVEQARLRPVMPFWYDVDMEYSRIENIAWRGDDHVWHDDRSGRTFKTGDAHFNTATGAGLEVFTGPFRFKDATLRVLPLVAELKTLQEALNESVNKATGNVRFDVWSSGGAYCYIYLLVHEWGSVSSETDDYGDWATQTVSFHVPVKHMVNGQCVGFGLYPLTTFAEGTPQTCTLSELYGIYSYESSFTNAQQAWTTEGAELHSLLSVSAQVLPALGHGEETRHCRILEFVRPTKKERPAGVSVIIEQDTEHESQPADAAAESQALRLAAEVIALARPLSVFTLKAFRDAHSPAQACYQALVRIPWSVTELEEASVSKTPIHVRISEYPSMPIVSRLGLVALTVDNGAGATIYTVSAKDCFTIRAQLRLENGEELGQRVAVEDKDEQAAVEPEHWACAKTSIIPPPVLDEQFSREHPEWTTSGIADLCAKVRAYVYRKKGLDAVLAPSVVPPAMDSAANYSEPSRLSPNQTLIEGLARLDPQHILRTLLKSTELIGKAD
jgi:hypothetical protein